MALPPLSTQDPSSFSNDAEIKVKHVHLDLEVDFTSKILSGTVIHTAMVQQSGADHIVLDTSFLNVSKASLLHSDGSESPLQFVVHDRHTFVGSALVIQLGQSYQAQDEIKIKIDYKTTNKCTAVQWLEPSQTAGKVHPYLFTQCQAIHARSLLPCQDTPNVKITYSADITCPGHLRALMSAIPCGDGVSVSVGKKYSFVQNTSIPSYLIALAVGNLVGRPIGPRSTVWSEPEIVESAQWEFQQDTENFIALGEQLLTPYTWGRYDLLLLPGSFPYGGMENPCLTFVTPSLLSGDRSLVDVVAHEIAHSWAGNLVTTKNWEHFWLNEGFTVFIERKILGRLHGEQERHFSALIGYKSLTESVDHYKEINKMELTCLVPDLKGVDPDDAFSSIPYEKGFNLLFYLERLLGGADVFEPYLKAHVTEFSHKSITTSHFKDFLFSFFKKNHPEKVSLLEQVDWETWFKGQGLPPIKNEFDQTLAKACQDLAKKWISSETGPEGASPSDVDHFSPNQKVLFLDLLLGSTPFNHPKLINMDKLYKFGEYRNSEIRFRWQSLCLMTEYEPIFPEVVKFLGEIGRMKYVRPLYRALSKCKNGKQLAKDTFAKYKSFYHPICGSMVAKDLGVPY